ncbi:MAG: hypothetical protein HZRFUVUK_001979 [Candidatus Fervidibacterota bacterium]
MARKIKLGFIGAGGIARAHLHNLKGVEEAKVVAFADPNIDAAKRMAEECGLIVKEGKTVFVDWREMIERVEMDAVLILSPHSFHCEQILTALEHNLHVLTEKPMVVKTSEAKKVINAMRQHGKVVVVSYQRRFMSHFRFAREQVVKGNLGTPKFVEAFVSQNWQRMTAGTWRQVPKISGGGFLIDSGSHIFDIVLWSMPSMPTQVTATMSNDGAPVEVNGVVGIKFESGALASVVAVGNATDYLEHYTFIGEDGIIRLEPPRVMIGKPRPDKPWGVDWQAVEQSNMPQSSNPDRHFIDVVLGRTENESPPEEAMKVIAVTEAAYKAVKGGQAVEVRI